MVTKRTLPWERLIGVPTTFPPAPHTHDASEIVNLPSGRVETIFSDYIELPGSEVNIDLTNVTDLSGMFVFIVSARNSNTVDYGGWIVLHPNANAYSGAIKEIVVAGGTINGIANSTGGNGPNDRDYFYIAPAFGGAWNSAITFYKPHIFATMLSQSNYLYSTGDSKTAALRTYRADGIPANNLGYLSIDPDHLGYTYYIYITILHIRE